MKGWELALFLSLTFGAKICPASPSRAAAQPKEVLVLHSFGRDVEPFRTASTAFWETMAREWAEPINLHEVPLEMPGWNDAEAQAAFANFLERRLAGRPPDLVVSFGGSAVRFVAEYRYAHPANGMRWIRHLSRVLERDAAGGVVKMLGVVRDVTEEQQVRQTAARLRDEIAHLGRVTAMGEMAATLAHELNQPLAAIMNNAGAARRMIDAGATADPDDVRETIGDIVADAGRAGEIVRRVRGLAKREAPVVGPVDLNDIVSEVLRLVQADIAGSGISVQLELAPGLPKVRSDRIGLQEVLINLLVNAVDALKQVVGERVLIATEGLSSRR